jgi:tetratricopeptide (TPR) repeat protein
VTVDPQAGAPAAPVSLEATVDARNPWLGLVSFTEETRPFFYGREQEVAELARRVQRKLLTVLFGKSGLGKTSILRAGLVPQLREHNYCPVYVRIAYERDTPEPAEQIKDAIRRAAGASGEWTKVGVSSAGESLWEFLHHRDDVLCDAAGTKLIPLLIFDQFEELFTLAQSDEFGRARAARFIEELADLAENRPPQAFEARLEQDEMAAEHFDFARSDYRVLIALREDYLAPLESLKSIMPSLSQNRLRLAPMGSAQALEAVLRPGQNLVSEEVATAIVRFVAGTSELSNAEVEPALLSLICRELNDARVAQGREEISLDLLAGSHESILGNFYERSLADQPVAVRRIIEDELLTDSGFRENVAEETLVRRFEAAGAAPGALATLVNRRLLRIEERLDVRRVELTHDVICGVVKASRDQRHEREARETAERVLEQQRERARAARHALRRARSVATGCILLAVLALAAAVFGYMSAERARRAEHLAQQNRQLAEQARTHAEQLLGYLSDDFEKQLSSFGQDGVVAQFTQRQIDYFRSLPPELRDPQTVRYEAMALIEHANSEVQLGDTTTATRSATAAIGLLEGLQKSGDRSEATFVALDEAYASGCLSLANANSAGVPDDCRRPVTMIESLAGQPGASQPVREAYMLALTNLGWAEQTFDVDYEGSAKATGRAMEIGAALGAESLGDLRLSSLYAFAGAWRVNALANLDRNDEALQVGRRAIAVADGVLAKRPWYRLTLVARENTDGSLVGTASGALDPHAGQEFALQERETAQTLVSLDPGDVGLKNNFAIALTDVCVSFWAGGHLSEALGWCHKSFPVWAGLGVEQHLAGGFGIQVRYMWSRMARWQAISGDLTGALRDAARDQKLFETGSPPRLPDGSSSWFGSGFDMQIVQAELMYERGDFAGASRLAGQATGQLQGMKPVGDVHKLAQAYLLYNLSNIYGRAEYQLGHFQSSESAERIALQQNATVLPFDTSTLANRRDGAEISTWLAMALARQGKLSQAAQTIDPIVTFEQGLLARNHGDVWVPYELASALYAQALAEPTRRDVALKRAAALLDGLPPHLQRLHDVRQWRQWVAEPLPAH